ncbi:MAG: protein kinase, partial [Thermomicrobiales bacterium]
MTVELPVNAGQEVEDFVYRRQVASALHHRNILAILDIGEDHEWPYVVCEYFAGDSLRRIISNEAPFDVDDVAILIEQLAQGLAYAHQRGIIHGSLAPESIIVDSAGLAKVTG